MNLLITLFHLLFYMLTFMFDLVMNLWWVPFYDLVCVPDYSFLCAKDKIYKLNFLTLLCVGIFTHHKDLLV